MRHRTVTAVAGAVVVAGLGAWCGWLSAFHRTSGRAELTWLVTTAAVVAVDVALWDHRRDAPAASPWPRPGPGGARHALTGVAPWLVLIAVAAGWDSLGIDTGPHQYHLTISALAQAYRPLNAALLLVWILVGVGYGAARSRLTTASAVAVTGAPLDLGERRGAGGSTGGHAALLAGVPGLVAHRGAAGGPALLLPSSPPVGIAFWIAVPVAAVAMDVVARRSSGRVATGAEFVRFVSSATWANLVLVALWLAAG
ncbi:MAG TPA: hypothetical protein VHD39_05225, partial [Acidimicrobiales bacterium]|nr:hypothetical protein [Acidimicrobiales bacterium]